MFIYYKSFLPLRILNVQYLEETFAEKLELNLENLVQINPFFVVAIGDYNAKSSNCFCHDKTNFEGDAVES